RRGGRPARRGRVLARARGLAAAHVRVGLVGDAGAVRVDADRRVLRAVSRHARIAARSGGLAPLRVAAGRLDRPAPMRHAHAMSAWTLFRETLRIARQALAANLMRSLLALLGIVIGVATVIAMMSLINGFQRSFQKGIQSWGSNSIYIRTFRPGQAFAGQIPDSLRKRHAFSIDDAEALRERCASVAAVSPIKVAAAEIRLSYRDHTTKTTTVFGSDDGMLRTRGF